MAKQWGSVVGPFHQDRHSPILTWRLINYKNCASNLGLLLKLTLLQLKLTHCFNQSTFCLVAFTIHLADDSHLLHSVLCA